MKQIEKTNAQQILAAERCGYWSEGAGEAGRLRKNAHGRGEKT